MQLVRERESRIGCTAMMTPEPVGVPWSNHGVKSRECWFGTKMICWIRSLTKSRKES